VDATETVREFQIIPSDEDEAVGQSLLADAMRPRVALHPAARWRTKLWEAARWRDLAGALQRQGVQVILTGSQGDQPLGAAIAQGLDPPPLSLMGRVSLKQLAVVLREVDLAVTVDSGPMHIAAAVGTPVLALFGPTDPLRTGPLGPGRVLRRDLACSPCLQRRCQLPDTYLCMRDLQVREVLGAARDVLGSRTRRDSMQPQISRPASSLRREPRPRGSGDTIPQISARESFLEDP